MENIYEAYTKTVNNRIFYFVKKKVSYPELAGAPVVLEEYGMHSDFLKACSLAHIVDENIIHQLMQSLQLVAENAKVVTMSKEKSINKVVVRGAHSVLSRLGLAGI
ncbi:MAG: hypothetical protein JSS98_08755 [Bacteroidetes bacterium]|nr:hypothetical protein [Bacteroidota bacterium]